MIATAHIAAGAAIGVLGYNDGDRSVFRTVFVFGLISHAVLDRIPHEDYMLLFNVNNGMLSSIPLALIVALELIVNFLAIYRIAIRDAYNKKIMAALIATGIIGSALPDIRFLGLFFDWQWFLPIVRLANVFHQYFHGPHSPNLLGLATEIAMIALAYKIMFLARPEKSTATE